MQASTSAVLPDQAYVSPEAAVLTRLFVKLLGDDLSEAAYDAELAGLSYSASATKQGFLVTFYGCAGTHFTSLAQALQPRCIIAFIFATPGSMCSILVCQGWQRPAVRPVEKKLCGRTHSSGTAAPRAAGDIILNIGLYLED